MNKIMVILAKVRVRIMHRPLQHVITGVERISKVLRYFQEDVENLKEGLSY